MSRPTLLLVLLFLTALSVFWSVNVQAPGIISGSIVQARESASSVEGRVLLDPDIPSQHVHVRLLLLVRETDGLLLRLPAELEPDGRFRFEGLPGGLASLEAGTGDLREPQVRIEGLLVPDTGTCDDPRLQSLDLRGRVHMFELEILDFEGERAHPVAVGWRVSTPEEEGAPYAHWVAGKDGLVSFASSSDLVDLLVLARGARTAELFGVGYGRTVDLHEGWPVRLAAPAGLDLEADGVQLWARLHRTALDTRIDDARSLGRKFLRVTDEILLSGDVLELNVPLPGTWEVEWRAYRAVDDGLDRLDLGSERIPIE
ncbi:MAG: hypothetical protein V3T22_02825, partial [Planctomycetota bacterium]